MFKKMIAFNYTEIVFIETVAVIVSVKHYICYINLEIYSEIIAL